MDIKNYKFKFMNEETLAEMNKLLNSEHGKTLEDWSLECMFFGVERYKYHERIGMIEGSLLVIVGVGLLAGSVHIGKKIARKVEEKRNKKTDEVIEQA